MTDLFLFDTYAVLEIINGNKSYNLYLDCDIIINEFIFAELCYKLLRESYEKADYYINKYKEFIIFPDEETIKEAMKFRVGYKKQNLSMTDCIGYIMAKKLGIKFLTGDKEFEDMENVEFVK